MTLSTLLDAITPLPAEAGAAARAHLDALTKPPGSLGRLEEIAERLVTLRGAPPRVERPVILTLAADHGVVVEGVNTVWKHVRPSQRHPQGGRIQKAAPIHISNVLPVDPSTGRGTRVKFETRDGRKHRIAVGSGTDLGATGKK